MKRRTFLETGTGVTVALAMPATRGYRTSLPRVHSTPGDLLTLYDPRVKALAHIALDAAKSAGAEYADVRMTYGTTRGIMRDDHWGYRITLGLSVRALVQGYWGWAATPYLSEQDAPRVGLEAVRLAKAEASRGRPRAIDWGTIPTIQNGRWCTPIKIDPFTVATEELRDWVKGLLVYIGDLTNARGGGDRMAYGLCSVAFSKQERAFFSTEGSDLMQTVYTTSCSVSFQYKGMSGALALRPAQGGWDYVLDANLHEQVRAEMDRLDHVTAPLPVKTHLDVGRYDIVFSASTMASLLGATLAPATELDRALGYEANAGGTSYLGPDPLKYLGTSVAAPFITITANRSDPKGLATIGWDDDGVKPQNFTLIKDGVLMDYQTTREQAPWLASWYQKQGQPIRSHGCAAANDALSYTMQHTPNLTLAPGPGNLTQDDLIASLDRGLVVDGINTYMDFQWLNGLGKIGNNAMGVIEEVVHGRRVARYNLSSALMFRSPEFWKSVLALGGPASVETNLVGSCSKGDPAQSYNYSISAVPALAKQVAIIDPMRKA